MWQQVPLPRIQRVLEHLEDAGYDSLGVGSIQLIPFFPGVFLLSRYGPRREWILLGRQPQEVGHIICVTKAEARAREAGMAWNWECWAEWANYHEEAEIPPDFL
jgi:hypothetical protein